MKPPILALLALTLASCVTPAPAPPERERAEIRRMQQDAGEVHRLFFEGLAAEDLYSKAHELLTREAKGEMPYEAFYMGVTSARNLVPEAYQHLIEGMKQHRTGSPDADSMAVRWCNPDFGYSRNITLRAERIKKLGGGVITFWKVELSRADLESLRDGLLAWFRRQKEAANGQRLVHPPGWKYASVGSCACARDGASR